ncbi:MAG: peptidoglycan DD-metalloendopeptidase family protein [Carbonactinosporaceae bacterium]
MVAIPEGGRQLVVRRVMLAVVGGVLVMVCLGPVPGLEGAVPSASADPVDDRREVAAAADRLRSDVHASSRRLAAAEAAYEQSRARLPRARAVLSRARGEAAGARAYVAVLRRQLGQARTAEQRAETQLREVHGEIAAANAALGDVAQATYTQGPYSELAFVFEAETLADLARRIAAVRTVLESQNAALARLRDARGQLASQQAVLQRRRMEVAAQRVQAAQQLSRAQDLERRAAGAQEAVETLVDRRERAVEVAHEERAASLARYREMVEEQRRLERLIQAMGGAQPNNSVTVGGDGVLAAPVNGPVTSGYGMRYHPILGYRKLHTGTDFGAPEGSPVFAAAPGTVISAAYNRAYGNRVIIDHGQVNGVRLVTTYNHLSAVAVSDRDHVDQGTQLGAVGSTGWSTGPHLHFEVLENGHFVDPEDWL